MLEIRNIETHPYDEKLFNNDTLTLTNKVTVLSGPNGYGKTTLMRELKNALKANGAIEFDNNPRARKLTFSASEIFLDKSIDKNATIGFLSYDSHADDYSSTISKNIYNEDFAQVALRKTSSEGQNNLMSLMDLFDNAQAIAKEHQQLRQLVIFVDGIDSGLSVNLLHLIAKTLDAKLKQVERHNPNLEVFIIFTTNAYELVRNLPTIDPITVEPVSYKNYEDFYQDILDKAERN